MILKSHTQMLRKVIILFMAGVIGIISMLPIIPDLIALTGEKLPIPLIALQAVSFAQSGTALLIAVSIGVWLTPKVHLATPLLDALLNQGLPTKIPTHILASSIIGGLIGGLLIVSIHNVMYPYLSDTFIENSALLELPFYTRVLYGGITEELLIRWGLMSFLVWVLFRFFGKGQDQPAVVHYLIAIMMAALLFGLGHLPVALLLAGSLNGALVLYIMLANSIFGIIAGYLFWKYGLEASIGAHIVAQIVMSISKAL